MADLAIGVENMLYIWLPRIRRTLEIRAREAPSMKALVEMSVDSFSFLFKKKCQIKVSNAYSHYSKIETIHNFFEIEKDFWKIFW